MGLSLASQDDAFGDENRTADLELPGGEPYDLADGARVNGSLDAVGRVLSAVAVSGGVHCGTNSCAVRNASGDTRTPKSLAVGRNDADDGVGWTDESKEEQAKPGCRCSKTKR